MIASAPGLSCKLASQAPRCEPRAATPEPRAASPEHDLRGRHPRRRGGVVAQGHTLFARRARRCIGKILVRLTLDFRGWTHKICCAVHPRTRRTQNLVQGSAGERKSAGRRPRRSPRPLAARSTAGRPFAPVAGWSRHKHRGQAPSFERSSQASFVSAAGGPVTRGRQAGCEDRNQRTQPHRRMPQRRTAAKHPEVAARRRSTEPAAPDRRPAGRPADTDGRPPCGTPGRRGRTAVRARLAETAAARPVQPVPIWVDAQYEHGWMRSTSMGGCAV
jgi:hypothetical protein